MKKIFIFGAVFIFFQIIMPQFALAEDYYCYCGNVQNTYEKDICCNRPDPEGCVWTKPNDPCLGGFTNTDGGEVNLTNPLPGVTSVPILIGKVISAALGIVGSLALLMFIYGGFTWMLAAGNENAVTKGKNILTWAAIGMAVIFASYSLVSFVINSLTK
jgi:hypothetical protein